MAQVERVAAQGPQHLDVVRGLPAQPAAADPQHRGELGQDAAGWRGRRPAGRRRSRPRVQRGSGRPPAGGSGPAMAASATAPPMLSPSTKTGSPGWRCRADATASSRARTSSGVPGQRPRVAMRAEARLVVGLDQDPVGGGIAAEIGEGGAVVVEAVQRHDHRPRRCRRRPACDRDRPAGTSRRRGAGGQERGAGPEGRGAISTPWRRLPRPARSCARHRPGSGGSRAGGAG